MVPGTYTTGFYCAQENTIIYDIVTMPLYIMHADEILFNLSKKEAKRKKPVAGILFNLLYRSAHQIKGILVFYFMYGTYPKFQCG